MDFTPFKQVDSDEDSQEPESRCNDPGSRGQLSLDDGSYVITWHSRYQDTGSSDYGVYGQHYSAAGEPQGDEFQINTTTSGQQYYPSIASLDDGGFVVTWRDDNGATDSREGSGIDVFGQRFDATSAKGTRIHNF